MSWHDREYNQGDYEGGRISGPLRWLLSGSLPLGNWFGIRVRAHVSLLLFAVWMLIVETGGLSFQSALMWLVVLFTLILLHEFGHCIAARAVGGFADEIMLWPLGGLAMASSPRRPWPSFVTVAGGPLVNALICIALAAALWPIGHAVSWNPFHPVLAAGGAAHYMGLVFAVSYWLLLFNLLPIFPLDGGRMLQVALWPALGYFRSMHVASLTGMAGAALLAGVGIAKGNWLLLGVAIAGFIYCFQQRAALKAMGPEEFYEAMDYSESLSHRPRHHRRMSRWAVKRARRRVQKDQVEQERIDNILAKVSAQGMHSLSWLEKRALRKATERQRQRDLEFSRDR